LDEPPKLIEDSECILPANAVKITKIDRNELVNKILEEIRDVVADSYGTLTTTNAIQHRISLVAGAQPVKEKQRKVPHNYMSDFKKCIKEM
jgi:hypothetical protein